MKRFTETTKWNDPWFQDLSAGHKLFWFYICDHCDHAGIWTVNLKTASFFTGADLDSEQILAAFKDRIVDLKNGRWWVAKFCSFQYNTLSQNVLFHRKIIRTLEAYGLYKRLTTNGRPYPSHTPPIPTR